jgi:hypothetical protein
MRGYVERSQNDGSEAAPIRSRGVSGKGQLAMADPSGVASTVSAVDLRALMPSPPAGLKWPQNKRSKDYFQQARHEIPTVSDSRSSTGARTHQHGEAGGLHWEAWRGPGPPILGVGPVS